MTPAAESPSRSLRTAVAQMHPVPDDVAGNLATIGALVRLAAGQGAKLVVLPEMATTAYFIGDRLARLAEPEDGPTARTLGDLARETGVHLVVGMVIREGEAFYDAQSLWGPDGRRLATYRKVHLFASERELYRPGDRAMVVTTEIGRIGLSICYDLLFPEFIRRLCDLGADLVVNSTNWITDDFQRSTWGWSAPTVRALAMTRALENGTWLAMAACTGREWVFDSIGQSCVVAPSGLVLASAGEATGIAVAETLWQDSEALDRWRAIATYRQDRRPDLYAGDDRKADG